MIINGKNINLRTVEVDDAEFIYSMRKNQLRTKYLSEISGTIENQKEWIENYKVREKDNKEYYFILESKDNINYGLVRMYDFKNESFSWGSWLIKEDAPKTTAIESALQIYELGFYKLGFKRSHFEVHKNNKKVFSFHQKFGAKIVTENELEYFFNFEKSDYENTKKKYKRYL
jgi:RimJ/RimL family protein N-acetyltransferase